MKKSLTIAATAMVFACDSRIRMPQVYNDLEHSEVVAIKSLSEKDQAAYLKKKPLKVIRGGVLEGQAPDKLILEVLAVQRIKLVSGWGWRMKIGAGSDWFLFQVPDEGQAMVMSRGQLYETSMQKASDVNDPFGEIEEFEQAGTGQPATRFQSKSEVGDKPQPEAEGRSR